MFTITYRKQDEVHILICLICTVVKLKILKCLFKFIPKNVIRSHVDE